jgi:hypothetical protein
VPLRRAAFPFRWVPDTGRWYAIRPRFDIGGKPRCVVPDAIVEFHGAQRRVFRVRVGRDVVHRRVRKLTFVDGLGEFTRDQLHVELKSATGIYKKNYSNNIGNYLGNLMKTQQLHEVAKDKFSLPQTVRVGLEKKLAS